MAWSIHHVNLEAQNVRKTTEFYTVILGMEEQAWVFPTTRGYLPGDPDKLALLADGRDSHSGLHLIAPDPEFADKNDLSHNPSIGGHVAVEVDDLDAVVTRLESAGIRYSLTGEFAIPGMRHLYVEDPEGNLVEVNEKLQRPDPVRHLVLCQVLPGQEKSFENIMIELDRLRDRLEMDAMEWGANTSPEGLSRGYSHVFSIMFPSAAARDAYLEHPDHKALGAQLVGLCKGGVDGICVIDF